MSTDVYAPCPCGSGKKLKFCCNEIVAEMMRIAKLQQNHQAAQALRALEKLENQHPGNSWILTTKAAALVEEGSNNQAKQILDGLLETNPDHLFALALSAAISLSTNGFEASRPEIHRAFQRCSAAFPDIISGTAMGIAAVMFAQRKYMAARQHLTMAMRFAPDNNQQNIFSRLLDFDSNGDVPYALRGVHVLASYAPLDDEHLKEAEKAVRLSNLGCWALSARILEKLTEQDSDNASLRQNVGLCHAWDGSEIAAATALHKAAELHDDHETAVECETLAQLLDLNNADDNLNVVSLQYDVDSVGKLLTALDEQDRLARVSIPSEDEDQNEDAPQPAAIYNVLSRTLPDDDHKELLTLETVPNVLAEIAIFDHNPQEEEPARAFVTGIEGDDLQQAKTLFEEAVGDRIKETEKEEERQRTLESLPRDLSPLQWRWHFPAKTPLKRQKELEQQHWAYLVNDVWPNTSLKGLLGKTPLDAAQDSSSKVCLSAAVMVLDTHADRNRFVLDVNPLFERLNLNPPAPLELSPQTPLNALSAMQMHRLSITELSDEHLAGTLNRALLIHHNGFLHKVLLEILKRPACIEKIDCNRAYFTLAELCRDRFQREESLQWIAKGQAHSESTENAFENVLQWKMREMAFRLDDPEDRELHPLLKHLWDYYGPKVPQLRTYLATVVNTYDMQSPWGEEQGIVSPGADTDAASEGGIWTPGTETGAASDQEEKKLWLPGQD